MRTQGSLRLILNAKLWPQMQVDKASEKSVRVTAMDTEDQGVKVFLISVCHHHCPAFSLLHVSRITRFVYSFWVLSGVGCCIQLYSFFSICHTFGGEPNEPNGSQQNEMGSDLPGFVQNTLDFITEHFPFGVTGFRCKAFCNCLQLLSAILCLN